MDFYKLPNNSKKLLDELIDSENPTNTLSEKFRNATPEQVQNLRSIVRELSEYGYIQVTRWAGNLPYSVIINNSARTYNERLEEYESSKKSSPITIVDNSIKIGDGNVIEKSSFNSNNNQQQTNEHKNFFEKHPVITGIIVSVIAGVILMFSFWKTIVVWIEGLF